MDPFMVQGFVWWQPPPRHRYDTEHFIYDPVLHILLDIEVVIITAKGLFSTDFGQKKIKAMEIAWMVEAAHANTSFKAADRMFHVVSMLGLRLSCIIPRNPQNFEQDLSNQVASYLYLGRGCHAPLHESLRTMDESIPSGSFNTYFLLFWSWIVEK